MVLLDPVTRSDFKYVCVVIGIGSKNGLYVVRPVINDRINQSLFVLFFQQKVQPEVELIIMKAWRLNMMNQMDQDPRGVSSKSCLGSFWLNNISPQ